jgi:hypothetical protein
MLTLRVFLGAVVSADWTEEQSCHSATSPGKSGIHRDSPRGSSGCGGHFDPSILSDYPGGVRRGLVKRTTPGTSGRSPWLR